VCECEGCVGFGPTLWTVSVLFGRVNETESEQRRTGGRAGGQHAQRGECARRPKPCGSSRTVADARPRPTGARGRPRTLPPAPLGAHTRPAGHARPPPRPRCLAARSPPGEKNVHTYARKLAGGTELLWRRPDSSGFRRIAVSRRATLESSMRVLHAARAADRTPLAQRQTVGRHNWTAPAGRASSSWWASSSFPNRGPVERAAAGGRGQQSIGRQADELLARPRRGESCSPRAPEPQ